jgi:hypothetical protein
MVVIIFFFHCILSSIGPTNESPMIEDYIDFETEFSQINAKIESLRSDYSDTLAKIDADQGQTHDAYIAELQVECLTEKI